MTSRKIWCRIVSQIAETGKTEVAGMNCTRHITSEYNGIPRRRVIKNKKTAMQVIACVVERAMTKVKAGILRPLVSASALFVIIGIVGGMERGNISFVAAIPILLALCIGVFALTSD